MRIINCAQGTPEWHAARFGVPTASNFEKIVTPTGKLSAQSRKYAFKLATEKLLNRTLDDITNLQWVERGRALEETAAKMYAFETGLQTKPVGFILSDDGRVGASPDRLVLGANGAVELKCPAPWTHLSYVVDGFGCDYFVQSMGQCFVGEFDWVDRYSFHPEMPPASVRTYRDEPFIAKLREALDQFLDDLHEITEKAKRLGVVQAAEFVLTPEEQADEERGPRAPFLHTIINPFDDPTSTLMAG